MMKSTKAMAIALAIGLGFNGLANAEERAWAWSPLGIGIAAPILLSEDAAEFDQMCAAAPVGSLDEVASAEGLA